MASRTAKINAEPRLFTRMTKQEEDTLIEEIASEEALYECKNWFGMRAYDQQFYRDRVTRIIASLREKTGPRKSRTR